jgi:hypothetical protein
MKRDRKCLLCGEDDWTLQVRQNQSGSGDNPTVWNTSEVREWVCKCGGYAEQIDDDDSEEVGA